MVYGLGFRAKGPLVTRNHEYALEPRISSPRIYVRHHLATKEGRQRSPSISSHSYCMLQLSRQSLTCTTCSLVSSEPDTFICAFEFVSRESELSEANCKPASGTRRERPTGPPRGTSARASVEFLMRLTFILEATFEVAFRV